MFPHLNPPPVRSAPARPCVHDSVRSATRELLFCSLKLVSSVVSYSNPLYCSLQPATLRLPRVAARRQRRAFIQAFNHYALLFTVHSQYLKKIHSQAAETVIWLNLKSRPRSPLVAAGSLGLRRSTQEVQPCD